MKKCRLRVLLHLPHLVRTFRLFIVIQTKITGVNTLWDHGTNCCQTKQLHHGYPEKSEIGPFPSEPLFSSLQLSVQSDLM